MIAVAEASGDSGGYCGGNVIYGYRGGLLSC